MSGVPPLKPRVYYAATDLIERGRTAAARRQARVDREPGVRILGYHRISNDRDVLAVSPGAFRRQLDAVQRSGARIVPLGEALDALATSIEERLVCLTFDDGYRDNLTEALPILEELGAPATLYVPTQLLDDAPDYYWYRGPQPPALSCAEIVDLARDGRLDIQSHSRTHPSLPSLTEGEARSEIADSRDDLSAALGGPPTSFSYPAGLYGPREAALTAEAGYANAVTTRAGVNRPGQDPHQLCRTMIGWADDDRRFTAKMDGLLDRPSRLTEIAQRLRRGRR